LPVGVVTAISGATRLAASLTGVAGHAGTVPMALRRDALTGAANVIPGKVSFTMDIRAAADTHRRRAVADIVRRIESIARSRDLALQVDVTHENRTVPCAPWLKVQVAEAVAAEGFRVHELPSGAGHDGMAMIDIADVGMVFVRCRGGVSHNPAEHVDEADADAGARVLLRLIENFRPRPAADTSSPT
jgi:allantoate deiminase